MFRAKTVFVVGAGASKEYKFPLGNELKDRISGLIHFRHVSGVREGGDQAIYDALAIHAKTTGANRNTFHAACRRIVESLHLAISIDNFLEAHASDPAIVLAGKLGIVRAILEAEDASPLKMSPGDPPFDFGKTVDTWLTWLRRYATEGVSKENFLTALHIVNFIIFNYDRNVEHFLWLALIRYYGLTDDQAKEALSQVRFHHPYGAVGQLPWQEGDKPISHYGEEVDAGRLLRLAEEIKVFSEQIDDDQHSAMLDDLASAEVVVFLGFSFLEQNMRLLKLGRGSDVERVYATALGLSDSDCEVAKTTIRDTLAQENTTVDLQNTLTAVRLFGEYSKSLTQESSGGIAPV